MTKTGRIATSRQALARAHEAQPVERYHARMARLQAAAKREQATDKTLWCILRTSSSGTLRLSITLTEAGFEAWTPCEVRSWRKSGTRKRADRDAAMLPSFVFVRVSSDEVADLLRIMAMPVSPHPRFTLVHSYGRVPLIKGKEINGLRRAEDVATLAQMKKQRPRYVKGDQVRINQPAFVGLIGAVRTDGDKEVTVDLAMFGRPFSMKVATWQLIPVPVSGASSPEDLAAKAA